jgi:hypothetical protein
MMHERERSRPSPSTIRGKRWGQIVTRPAVKPHTTSILPCDDPEAVVLDLVQPERAARRLWSGCRKARRDKARRQGTRKQRHGRS